MSSKIFWWMVLIVLAGLTFYSLFGKIAPKPETVPISQIVSEVNSNHREGLRSSEKAIASFEMGITQ